MSHPVHPGRIVAPTPPAVTDDAADMTPSPAAAQPEDEAVLVTSDPPAPAPPTGARRDAAPARR